MIEIFLFVAGCVVGWHIGSAYQMYKMAKTIKSLIIHLDESTVLNTNATKITIEEINNVFYVYDTETNEFVCQGASIEEAAENFKKRKNNTVASFTHENKTLFFIDGKVVSSQAK